MSLRISSALGVIAALAACGGKVSPSPPGDSVDCAIGASVEMSAVCTLERVAEGGEIVIHHPDGGFRRFVRDPASGALVPLDGAEPLVMTEGEGGALQFAVGEDRYTIPPELLDPAPK
jgi:hypothetical protein